MSNCLTFALLTSVTLVAGTGCIAAAVGGAAAAGGIGYAYYKGSLERNYVGPVEPIYIAARKALESLKLPITNEHIEGSKAHLEARTTEGGRIRLWLEPVTSKIPSSPVLTRVTIRVDVFGDRETSRMVFDALDNQVGPSGIPPEERPVHTTPAIQITPASSSTVTPSQSPPLADQTERIPPEPIERPGRLVPVPTSP